MNSVAHSEPLNVIYGLSCTCHPEEGIRYVGQTSVGARMRFYHHTYLARQGADYPVSRWIRKHGAENIGHELLEVLGDAKGLDQAETRWINELSTLVSTGGLNLWPGGGSVRGYKHPPESVSRRTHKHSEETKMRLSQAASKRIGASSSARKLTAEQVLSIRDLYWRGRSARSIRDELFPQLSKNAVADAAKGRTWVDLPMPIGPGVQTPTGRFEKDHRAGPRKLTEQDIREIRLRDVSGRGSVSAIAREYGVTSENIRQIIHRHTWKHVV